MIMPKLLRTNLQSILILCPLAFTIKSCGTERKKPERPVETCTHREYVKLPTREEIGLDRCVVNGKALELEEGVPKPDGCNNMWCTRVEGIEEPLIFQTFIDCDDYREPCFLGEWLLTSCFKLLGQHGEKCECDKGRILCL
jgi:hypothetical protein